jgi:hypothetical protein
LTKLEYLIDLVVRRTIEEHSGDVTAATDTLRRISPFMNDDAIRALLCAALEQHGGAHANPAIAEPEGHQARSVNRGPCNLTLCLGVLLAAPVHWLGATDGTLLILR